MATEEEQVRKLHILVGNTLIFKLSAQPGHFAGKGATGPHPFELG